MSILDYFKRNKETENVASPSRISVTTERESEEIRKQLEEREEKGRKRRKYRSWTPSERAEIGKHASTYGNKSTVLKFQSKYPELTHQTVTDCKKAYEEEKKKNKGKEVIMVINYYCIISSKFIQRTYIHKSLSAAVKKKVLHS